MSKTISIENFLKMTPQVPEYSSKNQNYLIAGANPLYYLDDNTQEQQVAPLTASIDWTQISSSIIESLIGTQDSLVSVYSGSTDQFFGQSFTTTNAITLSGAQFYLKKLGSPTGAYFATIYAHTGTYGSTGTPTGSVLATSDALDPSVLTTSYVLTSFNFSGANKIPLAANTHYFLIITYAGGDSSDSVIVGIDSTSPVVTGNASFSTNGTSWTPNTTYAPIFYVYGGGIGTNFVEGNIVNMIPSTNNIYSIYAITDTTHVYGITQSLITDLGYITGSSQPGNAGGYLAIGGGGSATQGYLFGTNATNPDVYQMTLPGTGAGNWTQFGSSQVQTSVGVHIMEPFLDFIAIKDGSTSFIDGSLINKLNMSDMSSINAGINVGVGYSIFQMRNYNNKYLAIAAGKAVAPSASGYPQNYIFLWDGISPRYNYSIKVQGQFIDMKVIDSVLYVAIKVSAFKTCLYQLVNTSLRKVFTSQISNIRNQQSSSKYAPILCSLFDFKSYVGINLDPAVSATLTNPILIHGSDEMGELEFIYSSGHDFDQINVGYDGNLYAAEYIAANSNSNVYTIPATGSYQPIFYQSQWIPVDNLESIYIDYDMPPKSGTDAINVTIFGRGEDILTGFSTTILDSIIPTNTFSNRKAKLDVKGFTGSQIMVQLSTVNNSTWRPIIRSIDLITK